jgi:uncharacterized protein
LPNATNLVEQFIERLIEKSPEEIQKEGILPRGSKEEWESSLEEKVLVLTVSNADDYKAFIQNRFVQITIDRLKKGWQETKYIALYTTRDVVGVSNGIKEYGKVNRVSTDKDKVKFFIEGWQKTKHLIQPVKYGIANTMMTTFSQIKEAKELPELYMKNHQEMALWRMLRRVSDQIDIHLDHEILDQASAIKTYSFNDIVMHLNKDGKSISIIRGNKEHVINSELLVIQPSVVFKEVLSLI